MTTLSQNELFIAGYKTTQSNQELNLIQKQIACENIDRAAMQADWIIEIARMCGWLR